MFSSLPGTGQRSMMFRVRGLIGMYEYDRVGPPDFSFWFTLKGSVAPLLWTPSPAISGY